MLSEIRSSSTEDELAHSRLPSRLAYSDRAAWVMAAMSNLSYIQFEGNEAVAQEFIAKIAEIEGDRQRAEIETLVRDALNRDEGEAGLNKLEEALGKSDFQLVTTINQLGVHAFIAARETEKIAVVVFRGVDRNIKDIKEDMNANLVNRDDGLVHAGLLNAYFACHPNIIDSIKQLDGYTIYITGHSIGGALAIIAARELEQATGNIGACYTFGSPPVGNLEFFSTMKVPIYRIVNAADPVPRINSNLLFEFLIFLAGLIPFYSLRTSLVGFLNRFVGFLQVGDVRYLSKFTNGGNVEVVANSNPFALGRVLLPLLASGGRAALQNHSISEYRAKLRAISLSRRNDF